MSAIAEDDEVCVIRPQDVTNSINQEERNQQPVPKRSSLFILEPAVFLIFFALSLSDTVLQNQIMYSTCTYTFGYNKSDCLILGMEEPTEITKEIEGIVQPYVAKIFMIRSLFESIIPAIGSLFFGPWSDKFGRKPVIFSSFYGYLIGYLVLSVIAFFSTKYSINPWLFILTAIPTSISGGSCALITGICCYIVDVAGAGDTAYRMVLNEAAIYLGSMLGSLLSNYLVHATNSYVVFITSGICVILAISYLAIFVRETINSENMNRRSKLRELFRMGLVKDLFKTCFKARANYDRALIWLLMLALGISIFIMQGDGSIFYLFTIKKFDWTIKEYTEYYSVSIIVVTIGNVVGMYFLQKILRLSITSLALLSFGSCVLDSIIKATAIYSYQIYVATVFGLLRGINGPMCRTILSLIVPTSDIGKIYSFTTSLETLTPLGSAPLYTYIYSLTINSYPGAFNFVSSGLYLVCYVCIAIIFGVQKSNPQTAYTAIG